VLVVEDLHWASTALLDVVELIVAMGSGFPAEQFSDRPAGLSGPCGSVTVGPASDIGEAARRQAVPSGVRRSVRVRGLCRWRGARAG
jgi:hypothetical protein